MRDRDHAVTIEDERPPGSSLRDAIKYAMLERPDIRLDELITLLEDRGYDEPSRLTTAAIRSEFRHSLRLLRNAGLLRERGTTRQK
jgi:hypothetical protein